MEQTQTLLPREAAESMTVAEVMLSRPKTMPADATVADVRRVFDKPSMRTILLVEGTTFVGTLERPDVPESAPPDAAARGFARLDAERVRPDRLVRDVRAQLDRAPEGRVVVVGDDGVTLRGMLCLRNAHNAFCTDGS